MVWVDLENELAELFGQPDLSFEHAAACEIIYNKKLENYRLWALANKERVNEYRREWRRRNPDKKKEQAARYRKKHIKEASEYRKRNKESFRKSKQKWEAKNRDKVLEYKRRYRERQRAKSAAQNAAGCSQSGVAMLAK